MHFDSSRSSATLRSRAIASALVLAVVGTTGSALSADQPISGKVLKLKSGASFAALAKKYSKDTGSAAHGGKLCAAHGGTLGACFQTVPPFDKAAFSLKTNEISQPVHSVDGWHIIQALADVKPGHNQTFAEVKSSIETNLAGQQKQTAWQAWLAKMAKDFKGKVTYQTGYAPATTTTPTAPAPTTTG